MRDLQMRVGWLAVVLLALGDAVGAADRRAGATDFFLKDGDRVVMMGDSITEQHLYSTYVELWTLTRFPAWRLTFRNVGIDGDFSTGGADRFQRDVASLKPTAVTVDFGMNDGGYGPFDESAFSIYLNSLQSIADQARSNSIRVAWVTPQPVEKEENGPALQGYGETLEKFSEGVRAVAAANKGLFVDQFHPYLAVLDKARAADPTNRITGGDAIHPGPPGQALMAASILKAMAFPPLVSAAEVNVSELKIIQAVQCQITELQARAGGGIRFTRLDAALPFFPERARSILRWTPILEDLNDYRLKVVGLKPGKYEVRLDARKVAEYRDTSLAAGVNLASAALTDGPVAEQLRDIAAAVEAKNRYFCFQVFRGVSLASVNIPDFVDKEGRKTIMTLIEEQRRSAFTNRVASITRYEEAIRKALVIRSHRVEIVPADEGAK